MAFVDFEGIIKTVKSSQLFQKARASLGSSKRLGVSQEDADSFMGVLGALNKLTLTARKVPGENVLESEVLLTIQK